MKIVISNSSAVPIYEQITSQIKEAIFSGNLAPDELLPSIRQLAKDLRISVITTTRAYRDLEDQGFIVSVQGKGSYVLPRNDELARENALSKIETALIEVIRIASAAGVSQSEINEILTLLYREENHE